MKKVKKPKRGDVAVYSPEPFKPITVADLGSDRDPCFGKLYDLTTKECKMCGDSEICCAIFAQTMGKTRDKLNKEEKYKDLDTLVDIKAAKKYIRKLIREDKSKKEILDALQSKFELPREDVKLLYREYKKSKTKLY